MWTPEIAERNFQRLKKILLILLIFFPSVIVLVIFGYTSYINSTEEINTAIIRKQIDITRVCSEDECFNVPQYIVYTENESVVAPKHIYYALAQGNEYRVVLRGWNTFFSKRTLVSVSEQ